MIRRPPTSTLPYTSFPTRRSSDLHAVLADGRKERLLPGADPQLAADRNDVPRKQDPSGHSREQLDRERHHRAPARRRRDRRLRRSEEHTSELQSLMRNPYAVL